MPENKKSVPTKRRAAQAEHMVCSAADATSLVTALSNETYSLAHRIRYAIRHHPTLFAHLKPADRLLLWELLELASSKRNEGKPFTVGHDVLARNTNIPVRSIPKAIRRLTNSPIPFIRYTRGKLGRNSEFEVLRDPVSDAAKIGRLAVEVDWDAPPVPFKDWQQAQRTPSGATPQVPPLSRPAPQVPPPQASSTSGATPSGATAPKAVAALVKPNRERRTYTPYRPFPSTSGDSCAASETPQMEAFRLHARFGCPQTGKHHPEGCRDAGQCRTRLAIELARNEQIRVAV